MKKLLTSILAVAVALGMVSGPPVAEGSRLTYSATINVPDNGTYTRQITLPADAKSVSSVQNTLGNQLPFTYDAGNNEVSVTVAGGTDTVHDYYEYYNVSGTYKLDYGCDKTRCYDFLQTTNLNYNDVNRTKFKPEMRYRIIDNNQVIVGQWGEWRLPDFDITLGYGYRVALDRGFAVDVEYRWYNSRLEHKQNTYPVVVTYNSNSKPIITNDVTKIYTNQNSITIGGTVSDTESDTVSLSANVDGKAASQSVVVTPTGVKWSLNFIGVREGIYANVPISIDDGNDNIFQDVGPTIVVDRTKPSTPGIGVSL